MLDQLLKPAPLSLCENLPTVPEGLDLPQLAGEALRAASIHCTKEVTDALVAELGGEDCAISMIVGGIAGRYGRVEPFVLTPLAPAVTSEEVEGFVDIVQGFNLTRSDGLLLTTAASYARQIRTDLESQALAAAHLVRAWLVLNPPPPVLNGQGLRAFAPTLKYAIDVSHQANVALMILAVTEDDGIVASYHACQETGAAGRWIKQLQAQLEPQLQTMPKGGPVELQLQGETLRDSAGAMWATLAPEQQSKLDAIRDDLRGELLERLWAKLSEAGLPQRAAVPLLWMLGKPLLEAAHDIQSRETDTGLH